MDAIWTTVSVLAAVLATVQGVLVAVQAYEHRRYTRSRLRTLGSYHPSGRTILFVPCRGRDLGLGKNLACMFEQDYEDYEIRFLVESPEDPVCQAIQAVAAEYPERLSRIVFTGRATDCGQKVHNLLRGTEMLPPDVKYLAFADSDARPRPHWLAALVHRLDRDHIGAVTGYRWFVPMRTTLPNLLVTSINASLGMLYGYGNPNFVWGGSWAIRRDRFEQLEIRRAWQRKLTDDLVVTDILRQARLSIEYEPACAVASPVDFNTAQMLDFARRQYTQVRYYLPKFWRAGLLVNTFSLTAFYLSLVATIIMWRNGSSAAWAPTLVLVALYVSWVYRGIHCVWLSQELFPDYQRQLRAMRLLDVFGGPLAALANWLIFASSGIGRRLVWRGIHYELDRHGIVLTVRHEACRSVELSTNALTAKTEERTRMAGKTTLRGNAASRQVLSSSLPPP